MGNAATYMQIHAYTDERPKREQKGHLVRLRRPRVPLAVLLGPPKEKRRKGPPGAPGVAWRSGNVSSRMKHSCVWVLPFLREDRRRGLGKFGRPPPETLSSAAPDMPPSPHKRNPQAGRGRMNK